MRIIEFPEESINDLVRRSFERAEESSSFSDRRELEMIYRATLLQAWYGLNLETFLELVERNELFQRVLGTAVYDDILCRFTALEEHFTKTGALKKLIAFTLEELDGNKEFCELSSRILKWCHKTGSKEVFFEDYLNSPIRGGQLILFFPRSQAKFEATESNLYPFFKHLFPVRGKEPLPESMEDYEPLDAYFSEDLSYYFRVVSSLSIGVSINFNRDVKYKGWQPLHEFLCQFVDACQTFACDIELSSIELVFYNGFVIPKEAVCDRFYLASPPQGKMLRPGKSKLQSLNDVRDSWNSFEFKFAENDPRKLQTTLTLNERKSLKNKFEVELAINSIWDEHVALGKCAQVADRLKDLSYIAFHSLITQETRELLS